MIINNSSAFSEVLDTKIAYILLFVRLLTTSSCLKLPLLLPNVNGGVLSEPVRRLYCIVLHRLKFVKRLICKKYHATHHLAISEVMFYKIQIR